MPAAPNLPVNIDTTYADSGTDASVKTHQQHHDTLHAVVNSIYLANIGTTKTAAFTIAQANSGEVIPVNVSTSVAVTVPSLTVGTTVELVQLGTAGFTLTASGVTFVPTAGTPRAQGSTVALLWLTATSVLVSGDLA